MEVGPFAVSRSPVTNDRYATFVAATGHRPPAHWQSLHPPAWLAPHPVTYVDWADAQAFCAWAGVRLPSEAEWEKAARGTDGRPWPWGWEPPDTRRANFAGNLGSTMPVGAFPDGASAFGLLDMAGGVWEWTTGADADGRRILRGGSFNHPADDVRCAARDALYPDACDEYIGFRVAGDRPARRGDRPFDWVEVPAGPFWMGEPDAAAPDSGPGADASAAADEARPGLGTPSHIVDLAAFEIVRTPVTNAQYGAFISATSVRPPSQWGGLTVPVDRHDHPVTSVDWHEARAFCAWASVRLPTEAEWERAAAGPAGRSYPWGEAEPDATTAWFGELAEDVGTAPVEAHRAGASLDGALDLAGNVWEWTASLHRPYPYRPDDGREDALAAGRRVLRGGSFRSPSAVYLRCAFRSRSYPGRRREHIGFRVARTASTTDPVS